MKFKIITPFILLTICIIFTNSCIKKSEKLTLKNENKIVIDEEANLEKIAEGFDKKDAFTIVVLPDTQYYTSEKEYEGTYKRQMEWIAIHKDQLKIKYVIHVGDITQKNKKSQWEKAVDAHNILNDKVPYIMVPGDHDRMRFGIKWPCPVFSKFKEYFGDGSIFGRKNKNITYFENSSYASFENGTNKYLILCLDHNPTQKILNWANDVVKNDTNTVKNVIIVTHEYLKNDGNRTHIGDNIYNKLIKDNDNIFLVLSGHKGGSYYSIETRNNNVVHQILTNYQWESPKGIFNDGNRGRGGNGWLRTLTFLPNDKKIRVRVRVFSPEEGNQDFFEKGIEEFYGVKKKGGDFYPLYPKKREKKLPPDPTSNPHHNFDFEYLK